MISLWCHIYGEQQDIQALFSGVRPEPGSKKRTRHRSEPFGQTAQKRRRAPSHLRRLSNLRLTEVRRVVFDLEPDGFCLDSDQVSHGARLWGNLLGLMLPHAWLEQKNREIMELPNGERAVVATPEDYEAAYEIFKATCECSLVNLSDTHRKILDAVYELQMEMAFSDGYCRNTLSTESGGRGR